MADKSPTANREGTIPLPVFDPKKNARDNLRHAGEFTKIENNAIFLILSGWFATPTKPDKAREIVEASDNAWALTTLQEHFDSELNSDPTTRSRYSILVLAELQARAEAAKKVLDDLIGDSEEEERMNELTDKTVEEVIKKIGL
jgi:hypothetical protein